MILEPPVARILAGKSGSPDRRGEPGPEAPDDRDMPDEHGQGDPKERAEGADGVRPSHGLYLQLISVHGLIRGKNPELGRDADTGGQVTYVLELTRALAAHPDVDRVDLLTRRIEDPRFDPDYAQDLEELAPGAWLVRLDCGPRRYIRKELLWPYLDNFADQALKHIRRVDRVPDLLHSHYADAGHVGCLLSGYLGVPLVHTGHSLGRVKAKRLHDRGVALEKIESRYNMQRRIEAEETVLDNAALVIASTHQEVERQYELYDNYQPKRMRVLPPGVDLSRFCPPSRISRKPAIQDAVDRFLKQPGKPMILALSRPDPRKNVSSLVRAYGENRELRQLTNLVVVLGNRDDFRAMDREPRQVLAEFLHLVDLYDLYGSVAYPKHHEVEDVPGLYRLTAWRRGVFVNPALTEPFGLTLIEAAASGVPIVATHDGGPRDIIANCKNGILVDPLNVDSLGKALLEALSDRKRWKSWARSGIRGANRFYSWEGHVNRYLREARKLMGKPTKTLMPRQKSRLPLMDCLLVTDIDNTLLGDEEGLAALVNRLERAPMRAGFAIATGRNIDSARKILRRWKVPAPDVWITSVGAEIHYGTGLTPDIAWERHLDYRWQPDEIRHALSELPGLKLQSPEGQRKHKISYDVDPDLLPKIRDIARHLRQRKLEANLIYSHEAYLDVLPVRTSKGKALRYLAMKWGVPLERFLVAGDSGNDEEMLCGDTLAVVVGNYSEELAKLRGRPRIYFAEGHHAWGILEAVEHYQFFEEQPAVLDDEEELTSELSTQ